SECAEPLFDLIDDLRITGAKTARDHYDCRGWVLHHNTDLWRGAAPVDGVWGVWPMGSAWLALHAWERWLFSGDRRFLARRGWPAMKEAAEFVLDFLTEAPAGHPLAGRLVTNPSHSPENSFRRADGSVSMFTIGATMDLMIIRALLEACTEALDILGGEADFRSRIQDALARLAPLQISPRTGRLQEWIEDFEEPEPGHRHMSHLFGLHPAALITESGTPALFSAARKSLDHRLAHGGGGTGWSRAWVVNFFARLMDGEMAEHHLGALLGKSTQPNLFDSHPPFQIDGNFGGAAGIVEMLVQSHERDDQGDPLIRLLPALPARSCPSGRIRGVRTRGGLQVEVHWEEGRLSKCRVTAERDAKATIAWRNLAARLTLPRGASRELGPADLDPA
ncbi:MAG: hypothetical protein MH204_00685, partial [Fimbriimonadaceae bacterium]|nr:hypothetical protein [Fimbriimonadaceae bacterium]